MVLITTLFFPSVVSFVLVQFSRRHEGLDRQSAVTGLRFLAGKDVR